MMKIEIVKSVGYGRTAIGAFDNALCNAGVSNFNLIKLSSVIPEKCREIEEVKKYRRKLAHGDKLYCIYSSNIGKDVAAGIAYDRETKDGLGVFVEESGENEDVVKKMLNTSLDDLFLSRKWSKDVNNRHEFVVSARANEGLACALAIAVLKEEGWG